MRFAAKVDANHSEIVSGLREAGVQVLSLAAIGKGCADLLVHVRQDRHWVPTLVEPAPVTHLMYLLEVKDGKKAPSARKLTPQQYDFHTHWPVHVVTSLDEALTAIGLKGKL